jgi:hypothetical protein
MTSITKICSVEGCIYITRKYIDGFCSVHYSRYARTGQTNLQRDNTEGGLSEVLPRGRIAHNFVDMKDMRVAKLTVIRYFDTKNKAARWLCKCDCGTYLVVTRPALRATLNGSPTGTKSCGCSRMTGKGTRKAYKRKMTARQAAMNKAYNVYKKSAIKRSLDFNLARDRFHSLIESNCHYCGAEPSMKKIDDSIISENYIYFHNGLDRIDNSLGYIDSNVLPCCPICNHAKHTLTYNDFIEWIKKASIHLNFDYGEL